MRVRMLKTTGPYRAGEVVVVPAYTADNLIRSGRAERMDFRAQVVTKGVTA
jgi:hypothetical protein